MFWDFSPDRFDFQPPEPERYQGISLADLWTPPAQVQYPEAPSPINDPAQLDEAQKKALRRQATLLAAQAFGQASTNGQLGSALTGAAGAFEDQRMQAVSRAEQHQQAAYQAARQQAEMTARNADLQAKSNLERGQAEGKLALVRQVAEAEPAMAGQAEMLARTGDLDGLRKLASEVPHRQAMRRLGLDPDDPVAIDLYKQKQLDEQEVVHQQQLRGLELKDYYQKPLQLTPLDYIRQKEEIEGQVRAKYQARAASATAAGELKPRFGINNGAWGIVKVDPDGTPVFVRAKGQPEVAGNQTILKIKDPASGKEEVYAINPKDPDKGATQVRLPQKPKPQDARGPVGSIRGSIIEMLGGTVPKPKPAPAPQAKKAPGVKPPPTDAEVDKGVQTVKAEVGDLLPVQERALRTLLRQNVPPEEAIRRFKAMRR